MVAADWTGIAPQVGATLSTTQLKNIVLEIAAEEGDSYPTDIQAVVAERGAALSAANPGAELPNTTGSKPWEGALKAWYAQKSYLITLHGDFTGNVSTPPGDTAPEGNILMLILDADTGKITMLGLNMTQPAIDTGALGQMKEL